MKKEKPKYNLWQNSAFMVKTAWHACKSVPFFCLLIALINASKSVAELLISPVILGQIESGAPLGNLLGTIALFAGLLMVLAWLSSYAANAAFCGRIGVRMELIRQTGDKWAMTSYPNTLDPRMRALLDRAANAMGGNNQAAEYIWTTWTVLLTNLIGFAVYLFLLRGLPLWIAGLILVTAAAGYLVNRQVNEWTYRHRDEVADIHKKASYVSNLATKRQYAKDIRIFGLSDWIFDLWDKTVALYRAYAARRETVGLLAVAADLLLTLLRNGVAYAYLIRLALTRNLSVSEFLLYFGAITGFAQWITGILEQFGTLNKQSLDLTVIREFLEWPEPFKFEDGKPLAADHDIAYELRLENVRFRYPGADRDTICGISLTVHPGEKLAIVGLNGAGKTTLVKLCCGFLDPTEGRVLLNGEDIRDFNRRDYYALFTAVFQDFSLLEATVAENVAQRMEGIDLPRVRECLAQAGLTEKVASLPKGLDTPVGRQVYEDGVELSGGQTQRLMLARALYKNAPILVLDEPTAALDPIAEDDIYQKYSAMTKGRTSLFISHRLASTRFCDRILYLSGGVIAEEGTHEELLALGGGYAELFGIQSQYYQEGDPSHEE